MPDLIKYDDLLENDDKDIEIQKLIKENLLLNEFTSIKDLKMVIKDKMENDAFKFILKFCIMNPNYLNNISIEKVYVIYDYVFDHFIIIYKEYIDNLSNEEKLRIYKISTLKRIENDKLKEILDNKEFDEMKKGLIETKELINSPLFDLFSRNLTKLIVDQFWKIVIEENFVDFFKEIIRVFNKGIRDLFELSIYYKELYIENDGQK